jgi:hypothetical protein
MDVVEPDPPRIGTFIQICATTGRTVLCFELKQEPLRIMVDDELQRVAAPEMIEELKDDRVAVLGIDLRHADDAL